MYRAREDLRSFPEQGARIERSWIPTQRPAAISFFLDDRSNVWVAPAAPGTEERRRFEIFDAKGKYLGPVELPVAIEFSPVPFVRNGALYGVVRDELDTPYVVRARIIRP